MLTIELILIKWVTERILFVRSVRSDEGKTLFVRANIATEEDRELTKLWLLYPIVY